MIPDLDKQMRALTKTSKRIENDILNKQQALSIDESCINSDPNITRVGCTKRKKKRYQSFIFHPYHITKSDVGYKGACKWKILCYIR